MYFNTFGGNPVAAAAARAVIRFAREQDMLGHVNRVGEYLRSRLERLAMKHECIGHIQGRGLFVCVDLVKNRMSREPASELAAMLPDAMKQQGVLIGLTGPLGNCLKFRPPLVFCEADVDLTLAAFEKALNEIL